MRLLIWTVGTTLTLTLTACEDVNQYPLSGEECSPDDPVMTLDAADCNVAPLVSGV